MGPSWSAQPAGRAQTGGALANGLAAGAQSQSVRAPRQGPTVISASVPRDAAPTGPGVVSAARSFVVSHTAP